jgi:hypothetical protein
MIDGDLGGGLIKQRVARPGQGRSRGYRTLIAYRSGDCAVFLYAFAKSERENIEDDELASLREIAAASLKADGAALQRQVSEGLAMEVDYDQGTHDA